MGAHSKLSPSSSERWVNCPASIRLSEGAPPQPQSKAAAEGTVAHTLTEALLKGEADEFDLMELVGTKRKYGAFEFEITNEMLDGALLFKETIKKDEARLLKKPATIHRKIEQRLIASSIDKALWGKGDAVIFQKGNALLVYDYKYGKGYAVEVKDNYQLLSYLVGAMDTLAGKVYGHLELIVVQPRAPHADGPIRRWVVSKEKVAEFITLVKAAIVRTKDPNEKPLRGNWCVFCPAKQVDKKTGLPFCPAIKEGLQKALETDFEVISTETVKSLPDIDTMPLDKLALVLDWEDEIKDWVKAAHERAKSVLDSGGEVPRYKLVKGRKGNRTYVGGAEKKLDDYCAVLGDDALYKPRELLSPAQVEKAIGEKQFAALDITERAEPGKSLVPISDKRPAVKNAPEKDFIDLTKNDERVWPK